MNTTNSSSQLSEKDTITYLHQVIDDLPGYVYWKNKESIYMGCNLNVAKMAGLNSPDDIIGKQDKDLPWGSWQSEDFVAIDQEVMSTGKKNLSTNKIPLKNEESHYLYLRTEKVPLRDKYGEIIGVLGIAIDITDEKIIEQLHIKQKQENIIASLPGYIYWKNTNSEYMGCNDNLAKLSGLKDKSEIIGKTDYDFHWGEGQAASFVKDDQEVMREQVTKITEHIFHKPASGYYHIRTEKMPLYEEGRVVGVLAIAMDITELKNIQERLKKAEGRVEGMTLLSFSMAHELRTPLGTIKMTAQALKQYLPLLIGASKNLTNPENSDISDETLDEMRVGCDRIIKSANSANQIISMILTNLMADETKISTYNLCSIQECIQTSIDEYTFPLGNAKQIDISQVEDFQFRGEKDLVKHVFFNLFKNAFYFITKARKGGITIWTNQRGKYDKVYFQDTGYGILKGNLPKIFDKFYTVDTHHGTGVGLAFCKQVMKALGGNIQCKSEFGEYTQFILSFPKISK